VSHESVAMALTLFADPDDPADSNEYPGRDDPESEAGGAGEVGVEERAAAADGGAGR
jgi:hypothetical protein